MYFLLGVALVGSIVGWEAAWPILFYATIGLAILFMTWIDATETYGSSSIFYKSILVMPKTDCFCMHRVWSDPKSVHWVTRGFRVCAGLLAAASTAISWARRVAFIQARVWIVSAAWCTTSVVWLLSCVPLALCLIQCAADDRRLHKIQEKMDISANTLILRFRRVQSLWLVHDIVLGLFWFYLGFMLYDLTDDQDDSEWRTIFLSMLSWHIIIIVLYQCYFKAMWSLNPRKSSDSHSRPCCSPEDSPKIWSWIQIFCMVGIYVVVILRMQISHLVMMGFESPFHAIIASILVIVTCISHMVGRGPANPIQKSYTDSTSFDDGLVF